MLSAIVAEVATSARAAEPMTKDTLVYVGTYTGPASKGIYLFRLQTQNLEVSQNVTLVPLGLAAQTPSPSFIEIDPKRRLLFAVNEIDLGTVSAFSIADRTTFTRFVRLVLKVTRIIRVTIFGVSVRVTKAEAANRLTCGT